MKKAIILVSMAAGLAGCQTPDQKYVSRCSSQGHGWVLAAAFPVGGLLAVPMAAPAIAAAATNDSDKPCDPVEVAAACQRDHNEFPARPTMVGCKG